MSATPAEARVRYGALDARVEIDGAAPSDSPIIVLLHGFGGSADDLAPFARSLGVKGRFIFPEGPVDLTSDPRARAYGLAGRAWWPVDVDAREAEIAAGPRDLSTFAPEGLPAARMLLDALLDDVMRDLGPAPLVLVGFSQGAMLTTDLALRSDRPIAALVQLSTARITADAWIPRLASRRGVRLFKSHGRSDRDLSFAWAESFKDELVSAGWNVEWCPFDGGHEIPLRVLRALKKFLNET